MPYADIEKQRARNRRYYQEHRAEILAKVKAWKEEANPEHVVAKHKEWYEANKEKANAAGREWYLANREAATESAALSAKRRLEADPAKFRAQARDRNGRRRARQNDELVEKVDPWLVWERDQGICGICRKPADPDKWHLDHIIPIKQGGPHTYGNVRVAHAACNFRKAGSP